MLTRLFDEERNTDGVIVQRPGVGHFLTIRHPQIWPIARQIKEVQKDERQH
jgi:hypothetical protein